jgi:hypothetical protein
MKSTPTLLAALVVATLAFPLAGCGCGFDCNNNNDSDGPTLLDFGLSDALPEELSSVTLEIERVTFRSGSGDVVVDTFTIADLDLVDSPSFQIDLLEYAGLQQLVIIEDLELPSGSYSSVFIEINTADVNASFVMERDSGEMKPVTLAGDGLSLPGFRLDPGEEAFTVEFELAQSLAYRSADDSYRLSADGIRVVDSETSASLTGTIDDSLFDRVSPCDAKQDPESGNRVYLYEGTGLRRDDLADVFRSASGTTVPDDAIAPYAVGLVVENAPRGSWEYFFGFLPAGDYTLVFGCDTGTDDPVDYDGITLPLPDAQLYEITLDSGVQASCDLDDDTTC